MKEIKEGYKMTELGEIPNEWEVCQLDTNAEINPESLSGKTPKDLEISYIDIESVSTGEINGFKQYVFEEAPSRARRIVKKNDIIISTVRPYLKAFAMVKENVNNLVCSTGFAVVRCNNNQDCRYIYQYVLSDGYIEQLKNKMVGSNYPAVNSNDIKESLVILPPLLEQQKIADILSTVDEQIDNVDRLIEKTKELKKGLTQQLLTKGIGHTEFKETEVGVIPKEWEVKRLGDYVNILSGFPFESKLFNQENQGIPLIRIRDIVSSKISTYYSGIYDEQYIIKKGDILIGMDGDFYVEKWNNVDGLLNQRISTIKTKTSKVNIDFIYYKIKPEIERIHRLTPATTVKHLSTKDINNLKIAIPSVEEQIKIANILGEVDGKMESAQIKKEKLQQLKKGLMQQLLTGKIRVKVDEV